jgi:hypothetical protein
MGRAGHEVVDDQLRAPLEQLQQRFGLVADVEAVLVVDPHPRQIAPLRGESWSPRRVSFFSLASSARQAQLCGPVGGPHPRPGHRHAAPAQGDRTGPGAVPVPGPGRVVLAVRPAQPGHLLIEHRGHHLQARAHGQGQQAFLRRPGDLGHRHHHLLRDAHLPRQRVSLGRAAIFLIGVAHGGPSPSGVPCSGSPVTYHSAGSRWGTATFKFYEGRDILLVLALRGRDGTFLANPPMHTPVDVGYVLIAIGTEQQLSALQDAANQDR